jgi:hypothetical protein
MPFVSHLPILRLYRREAIFAHHFDGVVRPKHRLVLAKLLEEVFFPSNTGRKLRKNSGARNAPPVTAQGALDAICMVELGLRVILSTARR